MGDSYRQYFDLMPCYLTVQDRDLNLLKANGLFREDFGEHAERTCYQVYKQRSEKCEECPVERTFRDGKRHRSEQQVRTLDGRDLTVIVFTTPLLDENGAVTRVMEMSADITEVKELQEQLRFSQQRYQRLFEEVPCYISIQDPDLNLIEANRRFREDFGSGLGLKCHSVYKHRDEPCIPCAVQQTFEDGQVRQTEEVVTTEAGERKNVLVYATPVRRENGTIKSVMEMSTDITPIRQLQSQLEGIGLLISSISHGIKGLLTGLDGGMYLVNTGLSKNNTQRVEQGWEMVQRNIDRIRSTVLNILYYAKERDPNFETVEAGALAEEVFGLVAPRAAEQKVAYSKELSDDAGAFEADPRAMRAMLVNLLENSVDACRVDKKKADHHVFFRTRSTDDAVVFEIEDDGIGMDRETREKAFSLFFSSKGVEGTGLGLFIAHKIVASHGGSIDLDSELDRGTRFVVKIPKKKTIIPGA